MGIRMKCKVSIDSLKSTGFISNVRPVVALEILLRKKNSHKTCDTDSMPPFLESFIS